MGSQFRQVNCGGWRLAFPSTRAIIKNHVSQQVQVNLQDSTLSLQQHYRKVLHRLTQTLYTYSPVKSADRLISHQAQTFSAALIGLFVVSPFPTTTPFRPLDTIRHIGACLCEQPDKISPSWARSISFESPSSNSNCHHGRSNLDCQG